MALFLLAFFLALLAFAPISLAQTVESSQNIVLAKDKVINSDYFASGKNVEVLGTVNGDTYIAGGNVTFDGVVNGDLFAAGGNIKILGVVHGNIRTAGGNIQIEGTVDKNVTALGGTVNIEKGSKISGSLTAAGGNINIGSNLGKGATLAGGNVSILGVVNGDVMSAVRELRLEYGTQILGNLTYLSKNEVIKSGNNKITGKVTHNIPPQRNIDPQRFPRGNTGFGIYRFLVSLIFGAVFLYFFPRFSKKIADRVQNKFVSSLLWGILLMIVTPITTIILFVTILGIPFAILLFLAYFLLLLFGYIFSGIAIGNWLGDKYKFSKNPYLLMFAGLLVLFLIRIIPVVGPLTGFIATVAGFGAYLITEREFFIELRKKNLL